MCLKKYIENYPSSWKWFLDSYLRTESRWKIYSAVPVWSTALPAAFYKECLDAWSSLNKRDVVTYQDLMNQVTWNRRNILSEGKSLLITLFCINGELLRLATWFLRIAVFSICVDEDDKFYCKGKCFSWAVCSKRKCLLFVSKWRNNSSSRCYFLTQRIFLSQRIASHCSSQISREIPYAF